VATPRYLPQTNASFMSWLMKMSSILTSPDRRPFDFLSMFLAASPTIDWA